jgi:hypothetical protein
MLQETTDEMARNAARVYGRYLTFFHQYATEQGKESLPDSAYFAAFEAAKGVGNALLAYALFQAWGNTPEQFAAADAGGGCLPDR